MVTGVQADIESMAFQGYGVTRIDGKVLFVPRSVTGDKVWVKVTEEKKNYSIGEVTQIIEPSPWRMHPPCPFFNRCGGCQWQHINDSTQVVLKKEILMEILRKIGQLEDIPLFPAVSSPQPYGYRVRVQLKTKGKTIGYYKERSHQIVDIDHCLISHPLVNQIILLLHNTPPFFFQTKEVEIDISPEEGRGILILHPTSFNPKIKPSLNEFLQAHSILKGMAIVGKQGLIPLGDPTLHFTVSLNLQGKENGLRLRISPGSFSQVNLEQNQTLIHTVLEFSNVTKKDNLLDLYSGVGNLSLPLALMAKEVWGIEENRVAVEDARLNAERNGVKQCHFIQGRVEDILKDWRQERPDLIVLDPPRTGCKRALDGVVKLAPKKIVYVSCEPTTFARDLWLFSEKGYYLQRLSLIDMFPQTYHMEIVGLLQRNERVQGIQDSRG
jgi:23S rRNA (uracil1939-C5)-methyltransferase